eukprot:855595-Pyramimonas_sp.AAC.1
MLLWIPSLARLARGHVPLQRYSHAGSAPGRRQETRWSGRRAMPSHAPRACSEGCRPASTNKAHMTWPEASRPDSCSNSDDKKRVDPLGGTTGTSLRPCGSSS